MNEQLDISSAGTRPTQKLDLGIYALWTILVKFRSMVGIFVIIPTLMSLAVAVAIDPTYRSQALLAPANMAGSQGGLSSLGGDLGSSIRSSARAAWPA